MTDRFHSAWLTGDGRVSTSGAADRVFPWWSFTKAVLAFAVMRLVEQGRLELDAPRPGKPYTLRQLLTHRAGVPNYGRLAAYHEAVARGDDAWSREQLLQAVQIDDLDFEPGAGYSYSNVGYMLAREAVEEACGLSFSEALQQLVIRPLGLASVRLAETRADMAQVYWPALRIYDPCWVYHGLLIGTPIDAARLLHAVARNELLSPAALAAMFERFTRFDGPLLPGRPADDRAYALGLMLGHMEGTGRAWGHSGAGPGTTNAVYHFPDLDEPVTVAVFTDGEDEGAAEFEAVRIAREQ